MSNNQPQVTVGTTTVLLTRPSPPRTSRWHEVAEPASRAGCPQSGEQARGHDQRAPPPTSRRRPHRARPGSAGRPARTGRPSRRLGQGVVLPHRRGLGDHRRGAEWLRRCGPGGGQRRRLLRRPDRPRRLRWTAGTDGRLRRPAAGPARASSRARRRASSPRSARAPPGAPAPPGDPGTTTTPGRQASGGRRACGRRQPPACTVTVNSTPPASSTWASRTLSSSVPAAFCSRKTRAPSSSSTRSPGSGASVATTWSSGASGESWLIRRPACSSAPDCSTMLFTTVLAFSVRVSTMCVSSLDRWRSVSRPPCRARPPGSTRRRGAGRVAASARTGLAAFPRLGGSCLSPASRSVVPRAGSPPGDAGPPVVRRTGCGCCLPPRSSAAGRWCPSSATPTSCRSASAATTSRPRSATTRW